MAAIKKSRAAFTGAVTKALDRFKSMPFGQPEEIILIKAKDIERYLSSLTKTETGFNQTMEDAQQFAPEDEEEKAEFQLEEEFAADSFSDSLAATRDLGEQLLAYKAVLTGIALFRTDLDALQEALDMKPDQDHLSSFNSLQTLFTSLREQWITAELNPDHPVKAELEACKKSLTSIQGEVAAAKGKSDSHSSTSSSTSSSSPCCGGSSKHDLPSIDVPIFNGEILQWSTFWATFKSTIEDRKDLTNTQRLQYLRKAIKDPDTAALLTSPIESPDMYLEVVQLLKTRFNKTREIHRHLVKTITATSTPKQTRLELRRLADGARRSIDSLKATKHYDIESFLTSFYYLILPSKFQMLWDQQTKHSKGIPPIQQLLTFITDCAETLTFAQSSPIERPDAGKKLPYKKQEQHPKAKGNVHVVAPASTYKWECSLCKPDKHPLHACPKWNSFNIHQRLGHIQAKGLCSNCLSGGHSTSACKSTYRCRECSQMHHTTIHQQPPPSPASVNYSASRSSKLPDALMTTAQLLLTGPNGKTMKARALIDSGAGLSLISK